MFQDGANIVKKVKAIFAFKVTNGPGGKTSTWTIDVKNGNGSIEQNSNSKLICEISLKTQYLGVSRIFIVD